MESVHDSAPVLKGQRALVTGANSGIGAAVAEALGEAGAAVVVNYVAGEDKAAALVQQIRSAGGKSMAVHADVRKVDQVQAMFKKMFDS